ncbi:MAG TPA: helix-turn-helix domain-containing protein [Candidatus Acidoferrum sp.]|nr:helix-turn-helix domain-containing protein [Candidatus Acidoferrum sp.]
MYTHSAVTSANADFEGLICKGLGQRATSHIAAISVVQKLSPGRTLFSEGDAAENVYEVVRGTLRLYKLLPDGRRQITGFLSAGHLLGLAHEDCYLYTAEAITEVTLCRYPRARFVRMVDEVPGFARRLLDVTSNELCAAQDQMLLLGRKSAVEKVASFILTMAGRRGGQRSEVHIPMTRADIADYLGLTVETVSRTLTRLRQDGVIALQSACCIELRNPGRLEELGAGELAGDL